MIHAKPVSLNVRPFKVSNLCFEVGGILGESFTELGAKVSAFDFGNLYRAFREANLFHDVDPGRLRFDSNGIDTVTKITEPPSALGALRAETVKAALNKAINARANAVITKYGNIKGIVDTYRKVLTDKGMRILALISLSDDTTAKLNEAYDNFVSFPVLGKQSEFGPISLPPRPGVVTATISSTGSQLDSKTFEAGNQDPKGTSSAREDQTIVNFGYDYRVPHHENLAQNHRAHINLGDESLSNFMQSHYLDRMEEVFKNELASMDADINQLQVAYLNTILLSPIDGIVTGVYKNPGDPVGAGEPVFRVENNSEVLIVAKVVCRGPIAIGSKLQVETQVFDSDGSRVSIKAPVVDARGQSDNENWEIIAKCSNLDDAGNTIFPLGYNFDYDNTGASILEANE
jgi:hypothetical protein